MMDIKYKLKIISTFVKSKKHYDIIRTFTWENKKDALACQELLKKAEHSKYIRIEFVEFVEEKPLSA